MKFAVIRTGGKQYFVKEQDELFVERLPQDKGNTIEFDTLAKGDLEKEDIELGEPMIAEKVKGEIIDHMKGDKLHILRFKAKVRFRRRKGFRPFLTKIKITTI